MASGRTIWHYRLGFSHLDGRWQNELLPWNYRKLVLSYLKSDMQLLDMGTGGGELLKTFHHPSNRTQVTEAWQPKKLFEISKSGVGKLRQTLKLPSLYWCAAVVHSFSRADDIFPTS